MRLLKIQDQSHVYLQNAKGPLNFVLTMSTITLQRRSHIKGTLRKIWNVLSAVALMSVIAGAEWISGPSALCLVERRMAVLLEYRYDTSQSRVIYPSEPILAITALKQLHSYSSSIINDIVSNDCSTVSVGEIGGFVSRVIFLLALDGIDPFRPILPLRSFLGSLIGDKFKILEEKAVTDTNLRLLINAYVCFSHFAKFHQLCEDPLRNIGLLVNLNAALCAPSNSAGIDFVIPIVLENGKLGCINVQTKSLTSMLYPSDIRKVIANMGNSGFYSGRIPSLNIMLNLCPNTKRTCSVHDPSYPVFDVRTIVIQGISDIPIFMKEKYSEVLHKLLHMLKLNRLEVDFRDRKRKHLPVTTNLPEYGKHIWEDWEELGDSEQERDKGKKAFIMEWKQELSRIEKEVLNETAAKSLLGNDGAEEVKPPTSGSGKERLSILHNLEPNLC
jgi:hypothetical protein